MEPPRIASPLRNVTYALRQTAPHEGTAIVTMETLETLETLAAPPE